jgi:hypothetical protein
MPPFKARELHHRATARTGIPIAMGWGLVLTERQRGMTKTNEIRELTDIDLGAVSGDWIIELFAPSAQSVSAPPAADAQKMAVERQKIVSS